MREGLKVMEINWEKDNYFCRNSKHAGKLFERFRFFRERKCLSNRWICIKESEHLIEQFKEKDKMPLIAVS